MIIVCVLVIMWGVVLSPGIVRKIRSANSEHSISSFHHSLELLELSGPKAIQPAYRLAGGATSPVQNPRVSPIKPSTSIQPGPQLVLLRSSDQGGVNPMSDYYEYRDDARDYFDEYEALYGTDYDAGVGNEPAAAFSRDRYARREAALRRRNVLLGLLGTVAVTGVLGLMLSILWVLTVVVFVALVAYVGLMAWAATSGSISLSLPSQRRNTERHVARAVVYGDGRGRYAESSPADEWVDEEYYENEHGTPVASSHRLIDDDEQWWVEHPRAAVR